MQQTPRPRALRHVRGRRRVGQVDPVRAARRVARSAGPNGRAHAGARRNRARRRDPRHRAASPRPHRAARRGAALRRRPRAPHRDQGAAGARPRAKSCCRTATSTRRSPTRARAGCSTPDEVRNLSLWAAEDLLPDLTILLDLDESVGRDRLKARTKYDRLEDEEQDFHARVRAGYLALAAGRARPVPGAERDRLASSRSRPRSATGVRVCCDAPTSAALT